ncbi:hypothetical protein CDCA_CDCA01G0179 [Cyanidium caldarium]|uniref:Rab proteins geranylgeranyltransferase component A n=1 Tax=Cyanidium caldarium TaxID=2771 RepID=A0AAV9IPS5_CYACA|nr:hypothetical protein CDCA_CDCA01G0179 [Cyanidium caldarium]
MRPDGGTPQFNGDKESLSGDEVFDVVLEGTDWHVCLLAAALAHAQQRVLVLDANEVYGGTASGTISFTELFGDECSSTSVRVLHRGGYAAADMLTGARQSSFSVDRTPRFHFAADALIDTLISSGAGSYLVFRPVEAMYLILPSCATVAHPSGARCVRVPCSKADVFGWREASFAEKRTLMSLLRRCYLACERDRGTDTASVAFDASEEERCAARALLRDAPHTRRFLRDWVEPECAASLGYRRGLVSDLMWYAFAMATDAERSALDIAEGVQRVARFLRSILRYGTATPFLFGKHGTAEIGQALARRCAVKGGAVALRRGIAEVQIAGEVNGTATPRAQDIALRVHTSCGECVAGRVGAARMSCSDAEEESAVAAAADQKAPVVRFTGIRHQSLFESVASDGQVPGVALLRMPLHDGDQAPGGHSHAVASSSGVLCLRQVDGSAGVCPAGMYLVYAEIEALTGSTTASPLSLEMQQSILEGALRRVLRTLQPPGHDTTVPDADTLEQAFAAYAFVGAPTMPPMLHLQSAKAHCRLPVRWHPWFTDSTIATCRQAAHWFLAAGSPDPLHALESFFPPPTEPSAVDATATRSAPASAAATAVRPP